MTQYNHIDLIEFPAGSIEEFKASKKFFTQIFDRNFQDWGDGYAEVSF